MKLNDTDAASPSDGKTQALPNPCKLTECRGKPRCEKCVKAGLNAPVAPSPAPSIGGDVRVHRGDCGTYRPSGGADCRCTCGVAPSDATDEDELAPEHLRMADALDEIAKPLARGSASIVRRAAEMLRTRGVKTVDGGQHE